MKLVDGKVAVITGSGRGIGQATAKLFAEEGAIVVVNDLDAGPANDTVDMIKAAGGEAFAVPGSVTEPGFPEKLLAEAVARYGRLDILVNCAGYTWDGVIHHMSDEQWQAMLDIHATAPFRLIRAAAPYMREVAKQEIAQGKVNYRKIVNVSSVSGAYGNSGQINYAAGKAALIGITKTVAAEWGRFNINCNAVALGMIETRLTQPKEQAKPVQIGEREVTLGVPQMMLQAVSMLVPMGRPGKPEEAAGAILFLASPLANYVNGHILVVDGGMYRAGV